MGFRVERGGGEGKRVIFVLWKALAMKMLVRGEC